jgi:hypothetical protein
VYCVYSLVTGVSKWLPKWDFTLLQLVAESILGCQFIDRHVTEILPKKKKIRLTDGTIVHILQDSGDVPPSTSVETPNPVGPSTKVRVTRWVTLPPIRMAHV